MRATSILKRLESLDYVVEENVIYPAVYMPFDEVSEIIDDYVDGKGINFKSIPLPRRRRS
ncbi:hypothetical protein [Paenibacillus residui]|uniref:Uncharacterized protein n=1 Tax=Paenibacillus residui TaxID=629724 RepID=A0ABW3D9G1_9BACL